MPTENKIPNAIFVLIGSWILFDALFILIYFSPSQLRQNNSSGQGSKTKKQ